MLGVSAARAVTKENGGERDPAAWLPKKSLETQFSARNNDRFGDDGYVPVDGQRHRY